MEIERIISWIFAEFEIVIWKVIGNVETLEYELAFEIITQLECNRFLFATWNKNTRNNQDSALFSFWVLSEILLFWPNLLYAILEMLYVLNLNLKPDRCYFIKNSFMN